MEEEEYEQLSEETVETFPNYLVDYIALIYYLDSIQREQETNEPKLLH